MLKRSSPEHRVPQYANLGTLTSNTGVVNGLWRGPNQGTYWIITHMTVEHTFGASGYYWYDLTKGGLIIHGYASAGNGSSNTATALNSNTLIAPFILSSTERLRPCIWSGTNLETATFTIRYYEVVI